MRFQLQTALLREARTKAGLTQMALAKKFNWKAQYIANMERGAAGIPHHSVTKLSKLLKIKRTDLIRRMVADYAIYLEKVS